MKKTIIITGSSSGIGKATAQYFFQKRWNVAAKMRKPEDEKDIKESSIGGRLTIPLYSLYHGTKWAVEGFSESLSYELAQFGVNGKIIEPGTIKTDFTGRSEDTLTKEGLDSYESFIKKCDKQFAKFIDKAADPKLVAQTIYKAANDTSKRLRYIVGKDAKMFWTIRRYLGDGLAIKVVKKVLRLQ